MVSVVENNISPDSAFTVVRMEPSDILSLAGQFVVQYYTVMKKCPSGIHRFYKDDSSMIREDNPVCGQRMIHEKIMSLNLQDCQIAILKLDALRANGNSVLIHDHTHGWESAPEQGYKQAVEEDQAHNSEVKQDQIPVEHVTPHSSASPSIQQEAAKQSHPASSPPLPPVQSGPRSWAQMASKQPSQPVMNAQVSKGLRSNTNTSEYDASDDQHRSGLRQSVNPDGPQRYVVTFVHFV
ncbi:unnamed protein product [Trichobilharzia regenti]|nr:unnamed protein product [Trichobilharzia regenti]